MPSGQYDWPLIRIYSQSLISMYINNSNDCIPNILTAKYFFWGEKIDKRSALLLYLIKIRLFL